MALGLTAYTVEDMNCLVNLLADYIELDFEREEGVVYEKPRRTSHLAALRLGWRIGFADEKPMDNQVVDSGVS